MLDGCIQGILILPQKKNTLKYYFRILFSGKRQKLGIFHYLCNTWATFTIYILLGQLSLLCQFGKLSLGNFHSGKFHLGNFRSAQILALKYTYSSSHFRMLSLKVFTKAAIFEIKFVTFHKGEGSEKCHILFEWPFKPVS